MLYGKLFPVLTITNMVTMRNVRKMFGKFCNSVNYAQKTLPIFNIIYY
jgi:hypothetical protein